MAEMLKNRLNEHTVENEVGERCPKEESEGARRLISFYPSSK